MARARFLSHEDFGAAAWGALAALLRMPVEAREYLANGASHFRLVLEGLTPEAGRALRARIEGDTTPGLELYPRLWFGDRERAPGAAVLSGRREQLERLARTLGDDEPGPALRQALALESKPARQRWEVGGALLPARAAVMGVVNVTPDSFSDGGRYLEPGPAIEHGLRLVAEGADILDIGGESTRPGGATYGAGMEVVPVEEELRRVVPVIEGLVRQTQAPISIDTRKGEVARAALDAGARIVNDVSGLSHDPQLVRWAAERGASVCVMHSQGDLKTMQVKPHYHDLIGEVAAYLVDAAGRALDAGIPSARIAVDPGLGFGKEIEHNLELIRRLPAIAALGFAVLVGASRKSFIGKVTRVELPGERQAGSLAAAVLAAANSASVVRVHDVRATVEALRLTDAVLGD